MLCVLLIGDLFNPKKGPGFFSVYCFRKPQLNQRATGRKCPSCKNPLRDSWPKPLCRSCIADLVREESTQECKDLLSSVRKELAETLGTVRSLVEKKGQSSSQEQSSQSSLPPSTSRPVESESEDERGSVPPSTVYSEDEEARSSRYKLSLEEVDELLKAIYTTLEIQEGRP